MMGQSMRPVLGPNPLWYFLGTIRVAAVIGGLYLAVREDIPIRGPGAGRPRPGADSTRPTAVGPSGGEPSHPDRAASEEPPPRRVLDLLPHDGRRILEPVLASPGITQIELRDRSDLSKSKVSQTVSDLEKRGLLYRERQGRTYRVYPTDDLREVGP